MNRDGYAIAEPDDAHWRTSGHGLRHASLTERLGCTHTAVDRYRVEPGTVLDLPAPREALCVPLDAAGTLSAEATRPVPRYGIARVPAGVEASVTADADGTILVVSASVSPVSEDRIAVVDVGVLAYSIPPTSDIETARLTEELGCRGTKANVRRLRPGQAIPYHTEGSQEELFVPLDGPGTVRIAGTAYPIDRGTVVRVAPSVPRGAVNERREDRRWLMVGAPPTGAADEWDPGAEILEWPGTG